MGRASVFARSGFTALFVSATVSEAGSRVTVLVLPVIAVTVLAAAPWQMGVLQACALGAPLLVGLPAGALIDRARPRRVMVGCDVLRAALLVSVPLSAWMGVLSLGQMFIVALAAGVATVFADVAAQSVLPGLVSRDDLLRANSTLQIGTNAAEVAGPGAGGLLLRVLTAPTALLVDVVSFLVSALCLLWVPAPARDPREASPSSRRLGREIVDGLRFVFGDPVFRRITVCTALANFGAGIRLALVVVFGLRELGLSASALGLVLAVGAVGGIAAAMTLSRVSDLVGRNRIIAVAALGFAPFAALTPLAAGTAPTVLLAISTAGLAWVSVTYNVAQLSFRQRACPPELLGRMSASIRTLVLATPPLGAVLGGALAELWGFGPALWLAVGAMALAALPVMLSPLRRDQTGVGNGDA